VITQGSILELREISINVFVYELYLECNGHECEGVWLIIKYEVYRHDTIVFELLLKLLYKFDIRNRKRRVKHNK